MERSYFYDDVYYSAEDHRRFFAQIIGNGVSNTGSLIVSEKQNMTVQLGAGWAFADGASYENTAAKDLTCDIAEPTIDRIDRIIICFDNNPAQRRSYAYVKKGIPGANPVPPAITRDGYIFEYSVAQILIAAGKSYIEQDQITDERTNEAVCGYSNLHNIYRGLIINENGAVTMPHQSFIKTESKASVPITANSDFILPIEGVLLDKQGEIIGKNFVPKNDGIYNLWIELGFPDGTFTPGGTVEIYVYVNGKESFPIYASVAYDGTDNYFIGSGFDQLMAGDKVEFKLRTRRVGEGLSMHLIRIRIAKMA
ncbi:hypothetical protein GCM10011409_38070 [Lentibacillus populi]|uniref:Uncharacterized protein n=1 Tax=Lentibacillus populi TaxID=1827502 RepID=A0A9W5X7J0_9BACI|nr:hypothetical protein [Lentibacillus populi]GGB56885.1 hypothetical protein GCM10011409_38070 [Lentibacillus populi]